MVVATSRYIPRNAERLVREALSDTRVVTVNGARQVGKSTLVERLISSSPGAAERRLDIATDRAAATADPTAFVRHDGLLAIDEIQRAPDLVLSIKAEVDRDPTPGRFLLTGSARVLGLRALPDALVGRMETIELWPLSQGELAGVRDGFVDRVFSDDAVLRSAGGPSIAGVETRDSYIERAIRGGFPESVRRAPSRRTRFLDAYVNDLIDRDVTQLADIQHRATMKRMVRLMAAAMAQPLRIERLASELATSRRTVERYVALLEEVFLVKRLPSWSTSATGRTLQIPKLLFVDTGVAAAVTGLTPRSLARDDAKVGPLVENFVLAEIARQLTWSAVRADLYHYRTKDHVEVDGVLEARDGSVVGIEVKASLTARDEDFRGLRHLHRKVGDRFHRGVVLYAGDAVRAFGERMIAAPIDTLWAPGPDESNDEA